MKSSLKTSDVDAWFTPIRFAVLLALLIFANFPEVFFGTHTFFYRDYLTIVYPYAEYNHDCFLRGELPLWNPLNHCGVPYLAQWQKFVLYPGWWIFAAFDQSWAFGIFTLVHLFVGGITMYFLAFRWSGSRLGACLAGLAYTFNGLTQNSLTWPHIIAALAWTPLVILSVESACREGRRKVLLAALVGALQMLTGAPEQIIFTWLLAALFAGLLHWREHVPLMQIAIRFVSVVLLVTGLCAIQLLPFLDLIAHSQRSSEFASTPGAMPGGLSWAVPAWGWANLFVPLFNNRITPSGIYFQATQYLTSSYYVGIGSMVLAIWSVWRARSGRVLVSSLVFVAALVLAMGDNAYLYTAIKKVVPAVGFMRYPVKFMFLVMMVVPLLVSFAVSQIQSIVPERQVTELKRFGMLASLVVIIVFAILWFAKTSPLYPALAKFWPQVWDNGWTRAAYLVLISVALGAFVYLPRPATKLILGVSIVLIFWLDLQTHTSPSPNPTVPRWTYQPGIVKLKPRPEFGRARAFVTLGTQLEYLNFQMPDPVWDVIYNRAVLLHQLNVLEKYPVIGGAHTLLLPDTETVATLLNTTNALPAGLADFLGVSHMTKALTTEWETRSSYLPVLTIGQQPVFVDSKEILPSLVRDFDPRETVFLPLEAKHSVATTNHGAAKITSAKYSSSKITAEVDCETSSWVVVAQGFYHNWNAEIDGQPTKLWKANFGFQALEVPSGKHHVEILYRDRMFLVGAGLGVLSLIIVGITFVIAKKHSA